MQAVLVCLQAIDAQRLFLKQLFIMQAIVVLYQALLEQLLGNRLVLQAIGTSGQHVFNQF